jgi:predicted nucleic acid-binding protein
VRVFFDTNVLVSGFLARGLCADLLRLVLTEHTLVTSEVVLAELRDVLSSKGRLPAQQIEAIETFLREHPVAPSPVQTLELGLVEAALFVTGDQGVLACSKPPLTLVNPRGCWEQLRGAG